MYFRFTALVAMLLAAAATTQSRAAERNFDPFNPNEPYYDLPANWVEGFAPTANDHAIIGTGLTCVIRPDDGQNPIPPAEAKRITVAGGGTLSMLDQTTLILGEINPPNTSRIDGRLLTEEAGDLEGAIVIAGDHVIIGDGGEIRLNKSWVVRNPLGEGPYTLTLQSDCIDPCTPAATCGLLLHGAGFLEAPIVNDAIVLADLDLFQQSRCPIVLIDEPKSGCGIWSAAGEGSLEVRVEVTGSAQWQINEPAPECVNSFCNAPWITFYVDCTQLTGNVTLNSGRFQVGDGGSSVATFCTPGDLDWNGVHLEEKSARDPLIRVGYQSVAQFGGTCPP